MNYTATQLEREKNKVFDQLGNDIYTINYQLTKIKEAPVPRFKVNVTNKNKKAKMAKKPQIRVMTEFDVLEKLGYYLVSIPLSPEQTWRPKQKRRLMLARIGSAEEKTYTKMRKIDGTMIGMGRVEFDEANRLLRVTGADVNKMGVSPWIQLD